MQGEALLTVRGLRTEFDTQPRVAAVDGVDFTLPGGRTLGLVGESGSGKSVTAMSIARLLPTYARTSGSVVFAGRNLLTLSEREMRSVRGLSIGYIFQEPMTSLNPVLTIGEQVAEPARIHLGLSRRDAARHAIEVLESVAMPQAAARAKSFPHELSGGLRQRVMIAIALSCRPRLIIADEPTTALDVTIQDQILTLLAERSRDLGTAVILITHDLGVAARLCDEIGVMYAGQIVEHGTAADVLHQPRMPYTAALLRSIPSLTRNGRNRLRSIEGSPPRLSAMPVGCRFASRCQLVHDECHEVPPALTPRPDGALARCLATEPGGWADAV